MMAFDVTINTIEELMNHKCVGNNIFIKRGETQFFWEKNTIDDK